MSTTSDVITRGLVRRQSNAYRKLAAFEKTAASRRWLEDCDLVKLCKKFKSKSKKRCNKR